MSVKKKENGNDRKLIQVRVSDDVAKRMQEVMSISGTNTMTELFKKAFLTYETLQTEQAQGGKIIVEHGNKRERLLLP